MAAWVKGRQGGRQRRGEGARAQAGKAAPKPNNKNKAKPPWFPNCSSLYSSLLSCPVYQWHKKPATRREKSVYPVISTRSKLGAGGIQTAFSRRDSSENSDREGREGPPEPTRKNTPSPPHEDLKLGIVMGSEGVRKHHRQLPAFNSQGGRRDQKESPAPPQASLALSFTKRQNSIYIFFTQL